MHKIKSQNNMLLQFVGVIFTALALFAVASLHTPANTWASSDLSISCSDASACTITPVGTPLILEHGWYPGAQLEQLFVINNTSNRAGLVAIEVENLLQTKNLADVIMVEIRANSNAGALVYGPQSLTNFSNTGYFTIDPIAANQSKQYAVTARMLAVAGNQYQASSAIFDLRLGVEREEIPPENGGSNGGGSDDGDSDGGGSNDGGGSSSNSGGGSSSSDSGSTSSSDSSADTSTSASSSLSGDGTVLGALATQQTASVLGFSIQAQGDSDQEEVQDDADEREGDDEQQVRGMVAGALTESCSQAKLYLPLIILLVQLLLLILADYLIGYDRVFSKYGMTLVITLVSIILFYWLRDCSCYPTGSSFSLAVWICKWYWIVAVLLSVLEKAIDYLLQD